MLKEKTYFLAVFIILICGIFLGITKIADRHRQVLEVQRPQRRESKEAKSKFSLEEKKVEKVVLDKKLFSPPQKKEIKAEERQVIPEEIKEEPFAYRGWLIIKGKFYAIIEDRQLETTQFVPKGGIFKKFKLKIVSPEKIVLENDESLTLKLFEKEKEKGGSR